MSIINIKEIKRENLEELLVSMGQPKFRAGQILEWVGKGASSFDEMTNISKDLRELLKKNFYITSLSIETVEKSIDGTRKYLLKAIDGEYIEAVFMSYSYGNSLCISTQVGCNMGCKFCASTIGGKIRNLSAAEMLDEYLVIRNDTKADINHIVLMGMGEPFDNYEEVSSFLRLIHDEKGVNLSYRNITISTCGIVPMINQFANDFPQVNLAISLHSPYQDKRAAIMPIAKKYGLSELMQAAKDYTTKTSRRISYEYALISGQNDSESDAKALAKLLKGQLAHVNLIPLNGVAETGLNGSDKKAAIIFQKKLESLGIAATVRRTLGPDINAACGQLRKKHI